MSRGITGVSDRIIFALQALRGRCCDFGKACLIVE